MFCFGEKMILMNRLYNLYNLYNLCSRSAEQELQALTNGKDEANATHLSACKPNTRQVYNSNVLSSSQMMTHHFN